MNDKIKASELFTKLVINSQYALESGNDQRRRNIMKNHKTDYDEVSKLLLDMSSDIEYMRFSILKTVIITLVELGIIEEDVNLLDIHESNKLAKNALEMMLKEKSKCGSSKL